MALVFKGLVEFMESVKNNPTIEYVTIAHLDGPVRRQLERMDLRPETLLHWLEKVWSHENGPLPDLTSREEQLRALVTWFEHRMSHFYEENIRTLVLQAYADKGTRRPFYQTIQIQNPRPIGAPEPMPESMSELEPPPREHFMAAPASLDPLEPDLSATEMSPLTQAYRALGEQYTHLGKVSIGTADRISTLLERQLERMERALSASEERCRELENQLIALNKSHAEQGAQSQQNVVELARLSVTQQTVSQIGNAVQGYMVAKAMPGIPPALHALMGYIMSDQRMVNVLSLPEVQALFADPQMREQILTQIQQVAMMKRELATLQSTSGAGASASPA